jgi:hypothetical protein
MGRGLSPAVDSRSEIEALVEKTLWNPSDVIEQLVVSQKLLILMIRSVDELCRIALERQHQTLGGGSPAESPVGHVLEIVRAFQSFDNQTSPKSQRSSSVTASPSHGGNPLVFENTVDLKTCNLRVPAESPSKLENRLDDDDGVSWVAQRMSVTGERPTAANGPNLELRESSQVAVAGHEDAALPQPLQADPLPRGEYQKDIERLQRQLDASRTKVHLFQAVEKHMLHLNDVVEQFGLICATQRLAEGPNFAMVLEEFPRIREMAAAAAAAAGSSSGSSPLKHRKSITPSSPPLLPAASADVYGAVMSDLASASEEKKLRIAVGFQNAVIETLLRAQSAEKSRWEEEKRRLAGECEEAKRSLILFQQSADNERRVNFKRMEQLSRMLHANSAERPSVARPLSRVSMAVGGGLLQWQGHHASNEPLTYESLHPVDQSDAVFGTESRPLSRSSPSLGRALLPPVARSGTSGGAKLPVVPCCPEDIEGETLRRMAEVIKAQADIIEDMKAKSLPAESLSRRPTPVSPHDPQFTSKLKD